MVAHAGHAESGAKFLLLLRRAAEAFDHGAGCAEGRFRARASDLGIGLELIAPTVAHGGPSFDVGFCSAILLGDVEVDHFLAESFDCGMIGFCAGLEFAEELIERADCFGFELNALGEFVVGVAGKRGRRNWSGRSWIGCGGRRFGTGS